MVIILILFQLNIILINCWIYYNSLRKLCNIQEDIKKALYYTNQLLELVPDHPRAVGNKWYYEEALAADGNMDEEFNKRKGKLEISIYE